MIKTILVGATGSDGDNAAFAAALALARRFAAHLDMLHVKLDPVALAVTMATDVGSGAVTAGLLEQLEREADERESKAQEIFNRFCTGTGLATTSAPSPGGAASPSAQWHVETGEEPRWMTTYGVAADLIVAPRASDEEVGASATLEAVLLESGRPILIPAVTAMPASFARIAIAWKPTPQAARAVAAAMPLLVGAKEVVVLTVAEEAAERPGERDDAERLVRSLAWHGIAATMLRLTPGPEGAAATLLTSAGARADLLVIGGYGHSRLREWVFGGFTRHVLAGAPLPVLIAH